jgi:hypothetical protein
MPHKDLSKLLELLVQCEETTPNSVAIDATDWKNMSVVDLVEFLKELLGEY